MSLKHILIGESLSFSQVRGMNEAKVEVSTDAYVRTHGKKPSGKGSWIFLSDEKKGIDAPYFEAKPSLTFSQARKDAIEWAKKNNFDVIHVGP